VANSGREALLVIRKGATGNLAVGKNRLKLFSPDGDAKVFIRPRRTKKDQSVVLMLSRDALQANQNTIAMAVDRSASVQLINKTVQENPAAAQFILRLDPASSEPLVIEPLKKPQD
jgi:hypothetical protein